MKALLTTPLYEHFLVFPNFQQVISDAIEHTEIYPPLGLLYISSYANEHSDHQVEVLDTYALNMSHKNATAQIRLLKPDVVGLTAITTQYYDCVEMAKIVKSIDTDIHVCVGGPHASIYPHEILKSPHIDSVLMGEAEETFVSLLNHLDKDAPLTPLETSNNITYVNNGKFDVPIVKNLDLLPFPDRKTTPLDHYRTTFGKKELSTSIIAQRGCPYHCSFCANLYGHTCRRRSPENILAELTECKNLGIRKFTFWDDTFTIRKKWVKNICELILKQHLDITWECRGRVNVVNKEMLEVMFKAGCEKIHYGVESGSQRLLHYMNKAITLEQAKQAIKISKDIGFQTFTNWMIGLPSETIKEINQTKDFACSLEGLDFANFAVYYPLPNTEFYEMGMQKGFFNDYWREYTINPPEDFELRAWNYEIPLDILMGKLNECFRKFYARPSKIVDILKTCETLEDVKTYSKAGWWLLKDKAGNMF